MSLKQRSNTSMATMKRDPIDVFNIEESYGGGQVFADGLYRIETSRFGFFDFLKPGNEALCMIQVLQSLDAKGNDQGDAIVQYWPVGDKDRDGTVTVEPCTPVKGEKGLYAQIRLTEANTHDKLFQFSDFAIYMQHLKKAGYDMDAAGNDITSLDGTVTELGRTIKPEKKRSAIAIAEEGDDPNTRPKGPREVIDVKATPATASGKTNGKAKKPDDPETIVANYLVENALTEDNEADGTPFLIHRMALSKYASKDLALPAETVREVMAIYNDDAQLGAILTAAGWEKDGKFLRKSA